MRMATGLRLFDIGTENLQDTGQGYGDEHTGYAPDEAPKRQGDQDYEGREVELSPLKTWIDDIAQNHLGADRQDADIEDVRPIGCELNQGHEDGKGGDNHRSDGRDEIEDECKNTPKDRQIKAGNDSGQKEEQTGESTDDSLEKQILGNLAGDTFKHHRNLHSLALRYCRQQLWDDALPLQKARTGRRCIPTLQPW